MEFNYEEIVFTNPAGYVCDVIAKLESYEDANGKALDGFSLSSRITDSTAGTDKYQLTLSSTDLSYHGTYNIELEFCTKGYLCAKSGNT